MGYLPTLLEEAAFWNRMGPAVEAPFPIRFRTSGTTTFRLEGKKLWRFSEKGLTMVYGGREKNPEGEDVHFSRLPEVGRSFFYTHPRLAGCVSTPVTIIKECSEMWPNGQCDACGSGCDDLLECPNEECTLSREMKMAKVPDEVAAKINKAISDGIVENVWEGIDLLVDDLLDSVKLALESTFAPQFHQTRVEIVNTVYDYYARAYDQAAV